MVSDFVKGKARYNFPESIQKGIALHRSIDAFTDAHPVTKEAMLLFKKDYRLYSAPIVDILYDHFLATDEIIFTPASLQVFSQTVYQTLEDHLSFLPIQFAQMLPYMKKENWLYRYRTEEGIARSLQGLVRRAAYLTESETAVRLFKQHYGLLKKLYSSFMPDVKGFAQQQFGTFI